MFRCPICGTLMPGDPRTPPLCPNAANHPMMPQSHGPPFPPMQYGPVLPPPPGYAPQMPAYPPPRGRQRFRMRKLSTRDKRSLKGVGVVFALMLVFVCVMIPVVKLATFLSGTDTSPTVTVQTPHVITDATLGGTQDAFQAKYGSPSGTALTKSYQFSQGQVIAISSGDPSSDGQNHVVSLRIGPISGVWDAATATPICAEFLPTDAQFVQEQEVANLGPERIYTSANLAATFPANAWSTSIPGTLVMELGSGFPSNQGCILMLGG